MQGAGWGAGDGVESRIRGKEGVSQVSFAPPAPYCAGVKGAVAAWVRGWEVE